MTQHFKSFLSSASFSYRKLQFEYEDENEDDLFH